MVCCFLVFFFFFPFWIEILDLKRIEVCIPSVCASNWNISCEHLRPSWCAFVVKSTPISNNGLYKSINAESCGRACWSSLPRGGPFQLPWLEFLSSPTWAISTLYWLLSPRCFTRLYPRPKITLEIRVSSPTPLFVCPLWYSCSDTNFPIYNTWGQKAKASQQSSCR